MNECIFINTKITLNDLYCVKNYKNNKIYIFCVYTNI